MSAPLATRIAEEFAAAAGSLAPDSQRSRAIDALTARGLPSSRDENWKYVNLRSLEKVRFATAGAAPDLAITADQLPPQIQGYARYTFVDGVLAPALSASAAPPGIVVRSMRSSGSAPGNGALQSEGDLRFALLSEAFATDGAAIHVAADAQCPGCIELVFVASTEATRGASYPRIDLKVAPGARIGLIERHISVGSEANFINSLASVEIGRDSSVQHYRLQQVGARAVCFDTLRATLAQSSKYQLYSVNLGAQSARSTVHVQLAGANAEVGLFNASVASRTQVHDTFQLVEHIAPNTRTEQIFRGISAGRARVACNGKIVVRKDASGTDSRQSLRGLLAGADAEIDVRPQLEIYTDDVRCSHGATAGKLDDNMLFYLLSRGLDRATAMALLKWAFLEDVVARIEVPELRRQIEASLAGQLNETNALQGALQELL